MGIILTNTKLDLDNPTLREWCFFFIRNITSWSDKVRENLKKLTMISDTATEDIETRKAYEAMS